MLLPSSSLLSLPLLPDESGRNDPRNKVAITEKKIMNWNILSRIRISFRLSVNNAILPFSFLSVITLTES